MSAGERGLALALLAAALPGLVALAGYVLVVDGRPAFYRGTRLGRDRRPFTIYKVRTLRRGAERTLGGELLRQSHDLVLPGAAVVRDTRLDELPQLLNVLLGDMSFVGPRPERPEVYDAQCRAIAGYARRFAVRPGLVGTSQLFTPHGTAKKYRTLIDNGALRRGRTLARALGFVVFTAWTVLAKVCVRAAGAARVLSRRWRARAWRERRRHRRVVAPGASARFLADARQRVWRVVELSEETLRLQGPLFATPIPPAGCTLDLELITTLERGAERPARRSARCRGRIVEVRPGSRRTVLVLRFRPASERSDYMLHQYFLQTSLASPRRGWGRPARLHLALPAAAASVPSAFRAPGPGRAWLRASVPAARSPRPLSPASAHRRTPTRSE